MALRSIWNFALFHFHSLSITNQTQFVLSSTEKTKQIYIQALNFHQLSDRFDYGGQSIIGCEAKS